MAPYVEVRELQWSIQSNATQTKIESFFCEKWLPILPISCSFCLLFLKIGYNLYYKLSTSEQRPPVNYEQRPQKAGSKWRKTCLQRPLLNFWIIFFLKNMHKAFATMYFQGSTSFLIKIRLSYSGSSCFTLGCLMKFLIKILFGTSWPSK